MLLKVDFNCLHLYTSFFLDESGLNQEDRADDVKKVDVAVESFPLIIQ